MREQRMSQSISGSEGSMNVEFDFKEVAAFASERKNLELDLRDCEREERDIRDELSQKQSEIRKIKDKLGEKQVADWDATVPLLPTDLWYRGYALHVYSFKMPVPKIQLTFWPMDFQRFECGVLLDNHENPVYQWKQVPSVGEVGEINLN
jgi:hypothetical protein